MPPPKTVSVAREDNACRARSSAMRWAEKNGVEPSVTAMTDTYLKKPCFVAYHSSMSLVVFYEAEPLVPQHIINRPGRLEPR